MSTKRFGTFEAVFIPSLLSIFGVIMYLRLGWVVGNAGLGGALAIIVVANAISLATALSMSSIVTNIRIGPGGAHSVIAKSLGIEAGGAIGIPLYFSQAISVAFYIVGFSECWRWLFPGQSLLGVSLAVWVVMLVVSYYSARLAFRLQYGVLAVIVLSLFSIFLGRAVIQQPVTVAVAELPPAHFLAVFAVFFPAVTGVLAGASMSGELKDPKKSIPHGTLAAIAVSFVVYMSLAFWFASHASANELITNTAIVIERSRWQWLVVAGIMGATLSSALNMFITAPRTLFALGKNGVIPSSSSFVHIGKTGEPHTAILLTALIALITLLCGSLNQVAGLLTMFFLITYAIINVTVFIEQSIGIASFRPSFRVPRIIPFLGSVGCCAAMFLINARFSLIAFGVIICIYVILVRRETKLHSPDVRNGLLIFIAEQLAKAAARLPYHPKIWKPNLLVQAENIDELSAVIPFIHAVVYPSGRIMVFQIIQQQPQAEMLESGTAADQQKFIAYKEQLNTQLSASVEPLKDDGIFVETAVVETPDPGAGTTAILQAVRGMYFPPNTLFCLLSDDENKDLALRARIRKAVMEGLGVVVLKYHQQRGFGQQQVVNLWIRKGSPNVDLSILIALQLKNNWDGRVRLMQAVAHEQEREEAIVYLTRLGELARLPSDVAVEVLIGDFKEVVNKAPQADINILGMPEEPDLNAIRTVFNATQTSVLFLRDSKHESAMA